MKIKRRYPNYFSGFEETEHDVSTYEDLVNIDWIKHITEYKHDGDNFIRLSYSKKSFEDSPDILMAENEKTFWAVGYIYGNPEDIGLKEWKCSK